MNKKEIKNITCNNAKCPYNQKGYCKKITEKHLLNRISCEEREW